jgi:hypothetical protein
MTLEKFHGNEGASIRFVDFIYGADVRMIQGGGGFSFAPEAVEGLRIFRNRVGKKLESDKASEFEIFSLVDHTHPAAANLLNNAVVRDGPLRHADSLWAGTLEAICGQVNKRSKNGAPSALVPYRKDDVRTSSAGSELSQDAALA